MTFLENLLPPLNGNNTDEDWMRHALQLAHKAQEENEVPVGAVLISDQKIIGEGWNQPIAQNDPTAHAEIIAIRNAAQAIGNYRLIQTTLYVTLEPCAMCISAMIHARIGCLVFGALDPKSGVVQSVFNLMDQSFFNHTIKWKSGILQKECGELLREFFQEKRVIKRKRGNENP